MGKSDDDQIRIPETGNAAAGGGGTALGCLLCPCAAAARRAVSLRCVIALVLSACVLLSAIFWLPPFCSHGPGFVPDDPDAFHAEIQASFVLQKPLNFLSANAGRLEYDILEEIGVPNTKVSVISMQPLTLPNSTHVVFGVLPDPEVSLISPAALSVLRSSLIDLVLQHLNLSLTPTIFGNPSSFELLRFPGGITVIPPQTASIWDRTQALFYFKLNNSVDEIQKNLDQLKDELKSGLNLRSYENVYVQMTNRNGSTVAPPVVVQASVLSDVGDGDLLPNRLKQLAEVINKTNEKNLGLNHSVFGKVKEVRLSTYLEHSISSLAPSPSPSQPPSPSRCPSPSPYIPASPSLSPSLPPFPSPPLSPSRSPSPSPSPSSPSLARPPISSPESAIYAPAPAPAHETRGHPPMQSSPGPSGTNRGSFSKHNPYVSPSFPPNTDSAYSPSPVSLPSHPRNEVRSPTPGISPRHSALSPGASYGPSPVEHNRGGRISTSPTPFSPQMSPSSNSQAIVQRHKELWLLGFVGLLMHYILCGYMLCA